ncbi:MAG: HAD family phosphatase [Pseudomonadota bacterium]
MITDIVFDLGQVIAPFDRRRAYIRLLPLLPERWAEMVKRDLSSFESMLAAPAIALESGKMEFEEFSGIVQGILGINLSLDQFLNIWCDLFQMDEDVVGLGTRLSAHYGTWLASNTSKVHYDWIVGRFPRVLFFQAAALSFELGVMKPSRIFFRKAVDMFGIDPGRSVFIDDIPENVEGAVAVGMHGILFTGCHSLVEELRCLGIELDDRPSAPSVLKDGES